MIENVENFIVTINGSRYDARKDLEFVGSYDGPQRPYLRSHTKVAVYKEIREEHPDIYEVIKYKYWYVDKYKDKVEGVEDDTPQVEENRNFEGNMNFMNNDALEKLTKAIENISDKNRIEFAKEQIDEYAKEFIKEFVNKTYGALPQRIELVAKDVTYEKTGLFHKVFEPTLKLVNLNIPVYLCGPAGTGKNFMGEQIADALKLNFYYASSITQEFKLLGFIDGGGKYHETEFYRWAVNGGLFFLDELDGSCPDAAILLNSALANGYVDFPTGRIILNPTCRVIAAGNTCGLGADMIYTGRNVIDGATLDRFAKVDMDYDSRIESNLCQDDTLRNFLYDVRKSVKKNNINHIVGMRCMKYAYQMLVNGFDKQFIIDSVVTKGLGKDDINVIKADLDKSNIWCEFFK